MCTYEHHKSKSLHRVSFSLLFLWSLAGGTQLGHLHGTTGSDDPIATFLNCLYMRRRRLGVSGCEIDKRGAVHMVAPRPHRYLTRLCLSLPGGESDGKRRW